MHIIFSHPSIYFVKAGLFSYLILKLLLEFLSTKHKKKHWETNNYWWMCRCMSCRADSNIWLTFWMAWYKRKEKIDIYFFFSSLSGSCTRPFCEVGCAHSTSVGITFKTKHIMCRWSSLCLELQHPRVTSWCRTLSLVKGLSVELLTAGETLLLCFSTLGFVFILFEKPCPASHPLCWLPPDVFLLLFFVCLFLTGILRWYIFYDPLPSSLWPVLDGIISNWIWFD